jgi:hypothetical protein
VRRWWGEFVGTPPNETGVVVGVEVLATGELAGWAGCYTYGGFASTISERGVTDDHHLRHPCDEPP